MPDIPKPNNLNKIRFLCLVLASVSLLVVVISILVSQFRELNPLPTIQGKLLAEGKSLSAFELTDHHGKKFTNRNLHGKWHLLFYGYTSCPDICPSTLVDLSRVLEKARGSSDFKDLEVLFYTVDPDRDSTKRLSKYVTYFDDRMLGLAATSNQQKGKSDFESNLGILVSARDDTNVFLGHSVSIFLFNPEGQLQAVLKPMMNAEGLPAFDSDRIYRDYIEIRRFFAS